MFKLKIVTPEGPFGEFEASILNVRTSNGQVGLLKDHMSYLANLIKGDLSFVEKGKRRSFETGAGLVYFDKNVATVLLDSIKEV